MIFMCPKFNFLLIQLFSKRPYDNYGICKGKPSLYLLWVEIMAVEDRKVENMRSSECETWNDDFHSEQLRRCDNLSFFFKWGQRTLKYSGTQRLIQKCWSHELKYIKSLWLGFQSLEMEECEPDVKIRWMGRQGSVIHEGLQRKHTKAFILVEIVTFGGEWLE